MVVMAKIVLDFSLELGVRLVLILFAHVGFDVEHSAAKRRAEVSVDQRGNRRARLEEGERRAARTHLPLDVLICCLISQPSSPTG